MAQYEKLPEYVAATPQQVVQARKQLTELRKNPAFALMQGARRAAVQAKFHSGMVLTALEWVEFSDVVPPGFSTNINAGAAERSQEDDRQRRQAMAEFEEQERKRHQAPRLMTQREAQAYLGPVAYNKWVDEHQELIARTLL